MQGPPKHLNGKDEKGNIFPEVVATFSAKRLFGYKSLVCATAAIMILSFAV